MKNTPICKEFVVSILDTGRQIVAGEVVKDFCKQNLRLRHDVDVGRRRRGEEQRRCAAGQLQEVVHEL